MLQEIVVGSNMDKIYIVMNYVEHDLKSLMETMKQPFLPGAALFPCPQILRAGQVANTNGTNLCSAGSGQCHVLLWNVLLCSLELRLSCLFLFVL